jgi:hypothetical protein
MGILIVEKNVGNEFGVQKQIVALLLSVFLGKIDQLQIFFFHFYFFVLEKKGEQLQEL